MIGCQDVIRACQVAMGYKMRFRKDVIVDLICYRRWGHNEMDEPSFTQPLMYDVIRNKMSIPDSYAEKVMVSRTYNKVRSDGK